MKIRKKRKSSQVEEIDITSLLDILVILLVFLLRSFNDSELSVDIANELALPYSVSRAGAQHGIILQVNQQKNIFINTDIVGNLNDGETLNTLKSELLKRYKIKKDQVDSNKQKKEESFLINLIFDRGLTYETINDVMTTAAESGFGKYKLIIQGQE